MLKAIYDFKTIHVELTNACIHQCSNCSHFCGHHKTPFFMDWPTFQNAIHSLDDWPRRVGIMGGEPTLHPDFERFVRYADKVHPPHYRIGGGLRPIKNLAQYNMDAKQIKCNAANKFHGLALWTSVCPSYAKHYEVIKDCFVDEIINDHTTGGRHHPWLFTRKEYGIPDEQWLHLRNNCQWQRMIGSPSITPKGAFFCEVAAAMDMLFNGPGGWPVEPGWWRRGPEDYGDQLRWCEFCCACFLSEWRDSSEEIDDVSPAMYEMLQQAGSPKLKQPGRVVVHPVGKDAALSIQPLKKPLVVLDDPSLKVGAENRCLYPEQVTVLSPTPFPALNQLVQQKTGWVLLTDQEKAPVTEKRLSSLGGMICNPGSLHRFSDGTLFFHTRAHALREAGAERLRSIGSLSLLTSLWPSSKVVQLEEGFANLVNPDLEEWHQNLLLGGHLEWTYRREMNIRGNLDEVCRRRLLEPERNRIAEQALPLAQGCEALEALSPSLLSAEGRGDFLREALLCLTVAALSRQEPIVLSLLRQGGYCSLYAGALLAEGREVEDWLLDCVLHPKNEIQMGLSSLHRYYSCYERKQPLAPLASMGIAHELIQLAQDKREIVLAGDSPAARCMEAILQEAGCPPVCFADGIRYGRRIKGLPVLSWREMVEKHPYCLVVLCQGGTDDDDARLSLERLGFLGEIWEPHLLTREELAGNKPSKVLAGIEGELTTQVRQLRITHPQNSQLARQELKRILTRG